MIETIKNLKPITVTRTIITTTKSVSFRTIMAASEQEAEEIVNNGGISFGKYADETSDIISSQEIIKIEANKTEEDYSENK